MIEKLKNFIELTGGIVFGMIADGMKAVKESLGKIAVITQIALPVILSIYVKDIMNMIILSCVWYAVIVYFKRLDGIMNNRIGDGFPLPSCKLTEGEGTGFVSLTEGNEEEAIIYLSELEQYLKRRKLIKY